MAINFLDNIQLNQNQLLGVRIEQKTSDPSSGQQTGDIIYNSTTNILKYWNNSSWVSLTADTQGMVNFSITGDGNTSQTIINGGDIVFQGGNGITTGTSSASSLEKKLTITNSKPFDSLTLASSTGNNSTIANSGTITLAAGLGITTTNNGSGQVTIAATGTGSMSSFTAAGDSGSNQTISDGNTLTIAGGVGIDTVGSATDTITATLDLTELPSKSLASPSEDQMVFLSDGSEQGLISQDSIPLSVWAVPTGNVSFNSKKITSLLDPTAAQDAATKNYVDTNIVGNLIFQGGYNAAENSPNLDNNPTLNIKKGWSYVVTDGGSFFTETVETGDFLIAQQDDPTTLSHWVTVQNNIGIASASTPGIASFPSAGGLDVTAAGAVSLKSLGSAGTGGASATATTGVTIDTKGRVTGFTSQSISITSSQVSNFSTSTDTRIKARQFKASNSSAGTSHTFTHNLNSFDVIVQLYDVTEAGSTEGQTLNATVDRTSSNVVTVTTASSIGASTMRALIIEID